MSSPDRRLTDALHSVYDDIESGRLVRNTYTNRDAFVRHYGASKVHATLVVVEVSVDFYRSRSFETTMVLPKSLLAALRHSNPELYLGDICGKHSSVVRPWSELEDNTDDDYYAVQAHSDGNQEVPFWIQEPNEMIRHTTHVRLDFSGRVPLLAECIDDWQLKDCVDIVIPRALWQRIKWNRGNAITHDDWTRRYFELFHSELTSSDDSVADLIRRASARLCELGVSNLMTFDELIGDSKDDDYWMVTEITDVEQTDYEYWNNDDEHAIDCYAWLCSALLRLPPGSRPIVVDDVRRNV